MKPGAARAVQSWLHEADEKGEQLKFSTWTYHYIDHSPAHTERDVAVRLFSSLGSRPPAGGMRQRSFSESDSRPPSRKRYPPPQLEPLSHSRNAGGMVPPSGKAKPWPAGVWHHKPIRDPPPQVYHRGALFGGVRGGASHYTIHPEWPDYYGPPAQNTSDAVHWLILAICSLHYIDPFAPFSIDVTPPTIARDS